MKGLRYSRLATATLRARKREYAGLALGIMLAIALVFTLLFSGASQYAVMQAEWRSRVGYQDAIVFDAAGQDRQAINAFAQDVGEVSIIAQVEEADFALGYYDQTAQKLLSRQLVAGRLPQQRDDITLNRGALAQLRLSEDLGQQVSLSLAPISGGASQPSVQRTFTLVGILADQGDLQPNAFQFYSHMHTLPAGLVAPQAPITGSRAVTHWVLKLAPGVRFEAVQKSLEQTPLAGHAESYRLTLFGNTDLWAYVFFFALLCLSLLLCAVIAIMNVFSNRLKQREQQIGMLRAVGATRRQIWRIYGQEALLIALATAPAAIVLSLSAAKLLLMATTGAPLVVPAMALPVGLAASLLVVVLAAAWPLRTAGRLQPIRVIRDADWMLQHKRLRVRSQAQFQPAKLLAARAMRLNRRHATGISMLVTLCMAALSMLALLPLQLGGSESLAPEQKPAFMLYNSKGWSTSGGVSILPRAQGLGVGDIAQLTALPGVGRVTSYSSSEALLVVEKPTSYLADVPGSTLYDLQHVDRFFAQQLTAQELEQYKAGLQQTHQQTKQALETTGEPLRVMITVMDAQQLQSLSSLVTAGQLDIAQLDRGEAWLVNAPDTYVYEGDQGNLYATPHLQEDATEKQRFKNDAFHVGDQLDVRQLFMYEDEYQEHAGNSLSERQASKTRAVRPIAAVIDGAQAKPVLDTHAYFSLITTPAGLQAMGMHSRGPEKVNIYLSQVPDRQTEAWLFQQVERVGLRDPGMTAHNALKGARDMALSRLQAVALFVSLLVVFFVLCLSLINNSLTGRLRADRRAIGSLRALGADSKALGKVYMRQLMYMLLGGVLLGGVLSLGLTLWQSARRYKPYPPWVYAWVGGLEVALVMLLFVLTYLHLRRRLKGPLKQPVITQIREVG